MSEPTIDIIICTYDREELLLEAVRSLSKQENFSNCQIVIVNNAPTPLSKDTTVSLASHHCLLLEETSTGLSIARNHGITNSKAEWLVFFDDDARALPGYINKMKEIISETSFDCFGGAITSWWKYGKPRWLADDYGSKPILLEKRGILEQGYNWGSNIIIRRKPLEDIGMFPIYIGMKGKKLGYAAENIVQQKLREKGYTIGYDPNLIIEHVVMSQKLRLSWQLRWAYATGRDGRAIYPDQYKWKGMLRSLKNCVSRPLKALWFWATDNSFYWENFLLESLRPYYLFFGKLRSMWR